MVPVSFALDNETALALDENVTAGEDILTASNDYYFNASAEIDGDGSHDAPYKYLTSDRIRSNANIYLADGEYQLDVPKDIERVNIYGNDVNKTIISYYGLGFTVNNRLTVQNVTFAGMSIINCGDIVLNNTVFSNCQGPNHLSYGNNFGGAIYTGDNYPNAHVTIDNCTFENNFAVYGGAIYMGSGYLEIANSIFRNNLALNYGGAIACEFAENVKVSKSKFYNSKAMDDAGGAIYIRYADLTCSNVDFVNSSATFGSAITALKSDMSLSNIYCENNTAKWNGGAVYHMYGDFTLTNSKFVNNSARNGGALFLDNCGNCLLNRNQFISNNANVTGGAIYSLLCNFSKPVLGYNNFARNHALIMPNIFDSSNINLTIGNGNYTMYKSNPDEIIDLPASYNLRDYGYVTNVKNQEAGGNCWAFTAMAVIESCILKITGETLDLSEENMKNLMSLFSDYGWNILNNEGGYNPMPWGYLASWLGPVLENDDMTDDHSALSPILNSILHVQNILFLKRENYTDNDAIKSALLQYGAVGTNMAFENDFLNKTSYFCVNELACNHAVTIVGWDDSYSKNNFYWPGYIEGDGAWIVRNSWGPYWGDDGYFYVSYYDRSFAKPGDVFASYTIMFNDTIGYDKNYQYDIPGETNFLSTSSDSVWYKNIFRASDNEYLAAISTYFERITNWTSHIYVNGELVNVRHGRANPGYFTFDLSELIPLKIGDVFEVVFNVTVDGEVSFPVSEKAKLNNLLYGPNMSFMSYDGENWRDLYDLPWGYSMFAADSHVACIKAFTVLDEIETSVELFVENGDLIPSDIIAVIHDEYGNIVKYGNVTFTVNNFNYTVEVKNGVAWLQYAFLKDSNVIDAVFDAAGYRQSANSAVASKPDGEMGLDIGIEKFANNVNITFTSQYNVTGAFDVIINDELYEICLTDGISVLELSDLANGICNIAVNSSLLVPEGNCSFTVDVKNTSFISQNIVTDDETDLNYTITLVDGENNTVSGKPIIIKFNDEVMNITTDSNGQVTLPISLDAGDYVMNMSFEGDNDYLKSNFSSSIKVKAKVSIDLKIDRHVRDVSLKVNLSRKINDTIVIVVNNESLSCNVNDGIGDLTLYNLKNDNYTVGVVLDEERYSFEEYTSSFTVNVKNTDITADNLTVTDEDVINYTVLLTDEDGIPLSNMIIYYGVDGEIRNSTTDLNGNAVIPLSLSSGIHTIFVSFDGDNDYISSNASATVNVKTKLSCNLTVSRYANNATVYLNFNKKISDNVTVDINGNDWKIGVIDGYGYLILNNLDNGNYEVNVTLDENKYSYSLIGSSFDVDVKNTAIQASESVITNDEENFVYNLTFIDADGNFLANKSLEFKLGEDIFNRTTDSNGRITVPINLNPGDYTLTADFKGDDGYFASNFTSNIHVKTKVIVDVSFDKFQNNVLITVSLSKIINDTVTLVINSNGNNLTVTNKTAYLRLDNLSNGEYNVSVNLDDDKYDFNGIIADFDVNVKQTKIVASDLVVVENELAIFNVSLVDEDNNPVSNRTAEFNLDTLNYRNLTDVNGHITISFNLTGGIHVIETLFAGDDDYFKSYASNIIKVKPVVNVNVGYAVRLDDFIVQLKSENPNNETAIVKINNATYYVNLLENVNEVILNNLSDGSYDIEITLNNTEDYYFEDIASQFVIHTKKVNINSQDLTVYCSNKNAYKIALTDENGAFLVNETVSFVLNGKTYVVVTDENGEASLGFNLTSGKYLVEISYAGRKYYYANSTKSQSVTVKTTIVPDKLAKSFNSKFAVKFLGIDGKPLANSKVKFVFKGVEYNRVTNSKGYAYLVMSKTGNLKLVIKNTKTGEVLTKTVKVKPLSTKITAKNKKFKAKTKVKKYAVTLKAGKLPVKRVQVTLKIKGKLYKAKTNAKGKATFKIKKLTKKGKYSAVVKFKANKNYKASSKKVKITIK